MILFSPRSTWEGIKVASGRCIRVQNLESLFKNIEQTKESRSQNTYNSDMRLANDVPYRNFTRVGYISFLIFCIARNGRF